ncbi:hypothetical protein P3T22_005927, partial [Paraburkholderia sp. GAS348]
CTVPALPCLSSFFSLLEFTCSARDSFFGGKLTLPKMMN